MTEDPSDGLTTLGPGLGVNPEAMQAQVLAGQGRKASASSQDDLGHDSQDPSYITRMEHFEGIPHQEIYDHVRAMKVDVIADMGAKWRKIANNLSAKILGSRLALHRALSEGFGGEFAQAAETGANTFFDGAENLQHAVSTVGYRIGAVAGAAEAVKLSVPPPPKDAPTQGLLPGAESPTAVADNMRQQEEQRQVAIGVMNSVYKPNYQPAGDGVPTFIPVKVPEDGPPGTGPSNPGGGNPSGGAPGGPSSSPGGPGDKPGEQPGQQPAPGDKPQTAPANTEPGQGNPGGQQPGSPSPGAPTGDPQRTTAAGAPTGGPGSPTGGPGSPSSPGGPGAPGGPNQPPPPGRSVPGTPGGPASPAGGAPAPAAARNGMRPPMGGMPMGGAGGGRRDDESERKTPDYLVTDRQEELLGPNQPMMPPTIGDDAAATRPATDGDNYQ